MRSVATSALERLFSPFVSVPWDYEDCAAALPGSYKAPGLRLREMVLACVQAGQFESDSFSAQDELDCFPAPSLQWHASRIAYLMHSGWGDPLTLNLGLAGEKRKPILEDGYHRLAAAVLLRHESIMVDAMGSDCLTEAFFGPDSQELDPGDLVQVSENKQTVWCHALDGSTVGRFDWRYGLDVHTTVTAQMAGANQCLHCTHEPATLEDWRIFCDQMWRHHATFVDKDLLMEPCPAETQTMQAPAG